MTHTLPILVLVAPSAARWRVGSVPRCEWYMGTSLTSRGACGGKQVIKGGIFLTHVVDARHWFSSRGFFEWEPVTTALFRLIARTCAATRDVQVTIFHLSGAQGGFAGFPAMVGSTSTFGSPFREMNTCAPVFALPDTIILAREPQGG